MAVIRGTLGSKVRSAKVGGAIAAMLAAAIALWSCSFFEEDAYPGWLDYVAAKVDLRAAAAEAGIGAIRGIERLERLYYSETADTESALVCVLAYGDKGAALLALDGTTLAVRKAWTRDTLTSPEPLGPPLGATLGGFVCGTLAFDPSDLGAGPASISATVPPGDARIMVDTAEARNYYLRNDTTGTLKITEYDAGYGYLGDSFRPLDAAASSFALLDAEATGGSLRILASGATGAYAFGFASGAALVAATPLLEDAAAEKTGPLGIADGKAWLTADGIAAYRRDDRSRLELYPYGYSPSATAAATGPTVEALELDTDGIDVLGFEPRGDYWYLYERLSGRLYALRTWWP